jgi:ferrous iron transport protein A
MGQLLPLDLLRSGESAVVADIYGDPTWVGRMAELGLREGSRIEMIQSGSPCMLNIAGCKLCIRGDSTSCIMVSPIAASTQTVR